jgi:hypothetical protein
VKLLAILLLCAVAHADPARVDPAVVGTWQMTVTKSTGEWVVTFEADAAGRYRMRTTGPGTVPDDAGTLSASGGAWRMQKLSGGPVATGRYALVSGDAMTLTIGGHTVIWHRAGAAAAIPVPTGAAAEYERAKVLMDKKDYRGALPLLTDAADHGFANAQHMLGFVLQEGEPGVPKDPAAAARWFAKAAAQGNRASQYALAGMIEEGEGGLPKDPRRAAELYEASANQGFAAAQFAYGLSCEFVLNDRKRAIYFLELAAKQGEGMAGWTARWLRRPGTPHFKDESQLRNYMNQQVAAWMAASMPKTDMMITNYYNERWRMFYSQGDTAAGDRCKYNGSCY